MVPTLTSRSGRVTVDATDQGMPTAVRIEPAALRSDPHAVAEEILHACARIRLQRQVTQRAELTAAGVPDEVLGGMGLASADDLAAAELAEDVEAAGAAPWSRP